MAEERGNDLNMAPRSLWIVDKCKGMGVTPVSQDRPLSKLTTTVLTTTVITAGSLANCVIYQYNLTSTRRTQSSRKLYPPKVQKDFTTHPPEWLLAPSPAIATIAWALFTLSAASLLHLRRRDRYQNHILAATIILGILGSSIQLEVSIKDALRTQLPGWIGMGLLVSMVGHMVIYGMNEERSVEQEREVGTDSGELDMEKF